MLKEIDCFVTRDHSGTVDEDVGSVWSVEMYRPLIKEADEVKAHTTGRFTLVDSAIRALVDSKKIGDGFRVSANAKDDPKVDDLVPGQLFYMAKVAATNTTNEIAFDLARDAALTDLVTLALANDVTGIKLVFREPDPVAYVVNASTAWITTCSPDVPVNLNVGDRIRIGASTRGGFTDYCTVLEKVAYKQIANGIWTVAQISAATSTDLQWGHYKLAARSSISDDDQYFADPLGNKYGQSGETPVPLSVEGTHYAYRLSTNINCTLPPHTLPTHHLTTESTEVAMVIDQLRRRAGTLFDDSGRRFFPVFRMRKYLDSMVVPLTHTVKCVHKIKLCSYAVRSAAEDHEYQHGHELDPSDWIALELGGVQGEVMSNNPHANGAFAVLHSGHAGDALSGVVDHYESHPEGLVSVSLERPLSTMRDLRVTFRNAKGEPPRAARIHLWFKLTVTQG